MEDKEKSGPEPLNENEREALRSISEQIGEAARFNKWETVSYLRNKVIDAARLDIISPEDAIDASLPPSKIKAKKDRQT